MSKCPYCDFYSLTGQTPDMMDAYTDKIISSLEQWRARLGDTTADTLYFGGGTPSLLGGERIARMVEASKRCFGLEGAEITMEANPGDELSRVFAAFAASGGNRVSLGMQAAEDDQLVLLGRRHRFEDVEKSVAAAKHAGIDNISLDLMLGLPGQQGLPLQTISSVVSAASHALRLGARHVSAYLLKIEEGTDFYINQNKMSLPDEDTVAELYLAACQAFEMLGFHQYEISNFAMPGYESRHNLKYWNSDPCLGIGAAAHSFIGGRRFCYPRDLEAFLKGDPPVYEQPGGPIESAGEQEYIMLRLRLADGVIFSEFEKRFGHPVPETVSERARLLPPRLVAVDSEGIRLTRMGFLLSNPLIARILG